MTPILPIPAEARGAVRTFKAKLRRADIRFQAKFESLEAHRAASRWANCGSLGRARPRTWLHEDQVQDHRVWLTDAGAGNPWATGPLAPFPLRTLRIEGGALVSRKMA